MATILPADSASPPGLVRRPTASRVAVGMLFFTNGLLLATWVSRIPAIRTSLGLSHGTLGVVLLGVALGALMAMPVAGWGAARFGSHRVCRVVAVAFCATLPWLATAPGAWWLAVALFCFGAGNGALDVAMNAQAVAVEERYRRPIMSSFHALWSLGGLTGAALGGLAAAAGLSPLAHFTVAAALLGGTTVAVALPRLLDAGEAQVHATNIRTDERRGFAWPPGTIFALGAVGFCIMMGEGAIADWSAIFLRDSVGASEGLAATGYAAFSIAMAAARFLGDALCARFGAVTLVRAGSTLAAVGLAFGLVIDSPAAVLLGFAAVGAGFATIVPQVFSAAGRTPGIAPGPALAMVTTVGYTGFLVGPPLIGFAAEHLGLRAALGIIVAMSAATIVLAPSVGRNNPVES